MKLKKQLQDLSGPNGIDLRLRWIHSLTNLLIGVVVGGALKGGRRDHHHKDGRQDNGPEGASGENGS